ncbi:DUF4864 domain-containing protein [Octadecabacter sp. 1_MG-2023]|uniref:DUF4864 domain-containing protein n=1 Tax=unclassified Octadecabacter TaxID=196158 RepID=UPI001C087806|nr:MULTISPECIES: DUF4864 domain-containing protein [unclassified Octadecabacter]MBU2994464.1 DUF4864 domain-containing protein [Octadecabacter sp. B2R22]MDO6734245.1 DUF4864 domain-containing protein [Octadecabacter sp. 1_MG-2023]
MRSIKGAFLTLALFATAASAQDQSIEDVINNQLQAFRDRDVQEAWQYASPMIQGIFRTPETFGRMVENGYPMVWDNSDIRFLDRQETGSQTRQEVQIQGPDGLFYILDYEMIETPQGWLINAVQVIPAPEMFS